MDRREHWGTRIGLILAMAGNAIGFGNLLRFPVQATKNGGGAFMIPYFCALLLLGIPLMWIEWGLGRYGGSKGHGTSPGMFELIWRCRAAKYFGLLGVALPVCVVIYYIYIESWTLAYCYYSARGTFAGMTQHELQDFFSGLLGGNGYFPIYVFFALTVVLNFAVMRRGVSRGIETLARVALPLLFVLGIFLVVKVLTLGSPLPDHPERSVWNGLAFLWNPDFSKLGASKIWLAAAGQVFFTLSLGFGVIACYASYLRRNDDIVLSGLTTAATNEAAEVVVGGSIAIPLAFAFLGGAAVGAVAQQGAFSLGFVTMPLVFQKLPLGSLFSTLWFLLLFFAGITSSVALAQAAIAFAEDELGWSREKSVAAVWAFVFACANLVIFGAGALEEIDFWAGTAGIVVFALIEVVLFIWVFGPDRAWDEMRRGADLKLPRIIYYVMKYVTPVYLGGLVVAWLVQEGPTVWRMENVAPDQVPWRWAARGLMMALLVGLALLIRSSRHLKEDEAGGSGPGR